MQGRSPTRRAIKGEPFLLSSIIYCGYCGQRMMGVTRRQTWRRKDGQRARAEYRYYQCQSRINRDQCEYRTVSAPDLEDAVLAEMRESASTLIGDGQAPPAMVEPVEGTADEGRADVVRAEIATRLAAIGRRYEAVVERAASGGLTLAQLRVATVESAAATEAARAQLALAEAGTAGVRQLAEASRERLLYLWDDLAINERQEVVRTLVSKVVVKDRRPRVQLASD
jgi:hypothetical protein